MINRTSFLCLVSSVTGRQLTVFSISLVWAAETQKRALDSMMGVAGKPTTTVPMFLFNISRPNALKKATATFRHGANLHLTDDLTSPLPAPHLTWRSL